MSRVWTHGINDDNKEYEGGKTREKFDEVWRHRVAEGRYREKSCLKKVFYVGFLMIDYRDLKLSKYQNLSVHVSPYLMPGELVLLGHSTGGPYVSIWSF